MEKLHTPGWKEFSSGKINISIYYKAGTGIIFNTTVRTSDGGYIFNTRGIEHSLPANASDGAIAGMTLELLKKCRC
jgi:maltose-binding protein MalE